MIYLLLALATVSLIVCVYRMIIKQITKINYEDFAESFDEIDNAKNGKVIAGRLGEKRICTEINKMACEKIGLFNTYLISDDKTRSSEIDVIYILRSGIYIFESKNHIGSIKGRTSDDVWGKKRRFFDKYDYSFNNPAKQNCGHIYAFNKTFDLSQYSNATIHNIIVFNEKARLHIKKSKDVNCSIMCYKDIRFFLVKETVKAFFKKSLMKKEDMWSIGKKIAEANVKNKNFGEVHLENIRRRYGKGKENNNAKAS